MATYIVNKDTQGFRVTIDGKTNAYNTKWFNSMTPDGKKLIVGRNGTPRLNIDLEVDTVDVDGTPFDNTNTADELYLALEPIFFLIKNGGGGGGIEEAPQDGNPYARRNASWVSAGVPILTGTDQGGGVWTPPVPNPAQPAFWINLNDNLNEIFLYDFGESQWVSMDSDFIDFSRQGAHSNFSFFLDGGAGMNTTVGPRWSDDIRLQSFTLNINFDGSTGTLNIWSNGFIVGSKNFDIGLSYTTEFDDPIIIPANQHISPQLIDLPANAITTSLRIKYRKIYTP